MTVPLDLFERELDAFRSLGGDFARRHPRLARRLRREPGTWPDPHVERLVEGFALLAARIHRQLDDGVPELAEALLEALQPWELRPIPAITILELAPAAGLRRGLAVPRHTRVLAPAVRGVRCRFRTARTVHLWPVTLAGASLARSGPAATLTLDLAAPAGLALGALGLDHLTFFLDGEPSLMHLLYQRLLFRAEAIQVAAGPGGPVLELPPDALRPAGLEPSEAILADDPEADPGAALLRDYFTCPDAFMFVRIDGLDRAPLGGPGQGLQVRIRIPRWGDGERPRRLAGTLGPGQFRLGCVPAVNLFRQAAAPIRVTHRQATYPVIPEGWRPEAVEIHRIDRVTRVTAGPGGDTVVLVPPLFAAGRPGPGAAPGPYWQATRLRAGGDGAGPVELALAERDFQLQRAGPETLAVVLTCSNRDLPGQIPFGGGGPDRADYLLPDQPEVPRARALRKPTLRRRAPGPRDLLDRLTTRLALARLAPGAGDVAALRAALAMEHPDGRPPAAGGHLPGGPPRSAPDPGPPCAPSPIEAIVDLRTEPHTAWIPGRMTATPVQGTQVTVTFDEGRLAGTSLHLFATILERWFGQVCGPNTYVQFRLATRQQEGVIAQWPPRTAAGPLT